jgi:hypothetical protein
MHGSGSTRSAQAQAPTALDLAVSACAHDGVDPAATMIGFLNAG